ncbi:tRNA lysidine(34) synthetase TilS [Pedobacter panaciterrae]|uniref:tRNA(Ile)-lysidine synthase n=1 Tax=Pedobacter panaciterrae TaxID=363849 RepID=A0ABU8NQF1_9SPHI
MLPIQNFKDFISHNSLFIASDKILLAVSGGKDSVLMAHLFKLAGFDFGIAHCNFNLRADESQRDESFVRMLANSLEVPFYVTHFKTKNYAAAHKISTQMAARDLRYNWFEEIRESNNYNFIALAQHQDDAMETVLLNLTRGTGIAGLHGIFPKRDKLIRPLLFLSREQINELIAEHNIDFVEDSSNLSVDYARNKIRLKVIPHLKEINPNLEQTFEQNIQRFSETELVLQKAVSELREDLLVEKQNSLHLSIAKVKALKPQRLLIFELLRPFGFSELVVIELLQALNKQSGTSFYSSSHRITIDRDDLILNPIVEENLQLAFIHVNDQSVNLSQHKILMSFIDEPYFEKSTKRAFVDADKLMFPLVVRTWQSGDKFMPLGMKFFKNLSDFFIDEKIPLAEKAGVPILINGNGEIIWLGGMRQDDRYKVTSATKKVAIFDLK